jgi:hypothetical protein
MVELRGPVIWISGEDANGNEIYTYFNNTIMNAREGQTLELGDRIGG